MRERAEHRLQQFAKKMWQNIVFFFKPKIINIENETIYKDTGQLKLHELLIFIAQMSIFFALRLVCIFLEIVTLRPEILRQVCNIEKQDL